MGVEERLVIVNGVILHDTKENKTDEEKQEFLEIVRRLFDLSDEMTYDDFCNNLEELRQPNQFCDHEYAVWDAEDEFQCNLVVVEDVNNKTIFALSITTDEMQLTNTCDPWPFALGRPPVADIKRFKKYLRKQNIEAEYGQYILIRSA